MSSWVLRVGHEPDQRLIISHSAACALTAGGHAIESLDGAGDEHGQSLLPSIPPRVAVGGQRSAGSSVHMAGAARMGVEIGEVRGGGGGVAGPCPGGPGGGGAAAPPQEVTAASRTAAKNVAFIRPWPALARGTAAE